MKWLYALCVWIRRYSDDVAALRLGDVSAGVADRVCVCVCGLTLIWSSAVRQTRTRAAPRTRIMTRAPFPLHSIRFNARRSAWSGSDGGSRGRRMFRAAGGRGRGVRRGMRDGCRSRYAEDLLHSFMLVFHIRVDLMHISYVSKKKKIHFKNMIL